jgi:hypothetical protein
MHWRPLILGASLLALTTGCGASIGDGGGGGGGTTCVPAGIVRGLARSGLPAPGTGGTFTGFPTNVPMDVAAGGLATFVAGTTDVTVPRVLYAALADGTLVPVLAAADVVPDAGGGTIADFLRCHVSAAGRILALVTITGDGGGRTRGLLTARIDMGAVVDVHDVIYDTADMAATGLGGTLVSIDPVRTFLGEDGSVWFAGTTSAGGEGLWRAQPDGAGLALEVGTGTALPGGVMVTDLESVQVHSNGTRFGFFALRSDAQVALYMGTAGSATYAPIAVEGQSLPGGTSLDTLPAIQNFVVFASGAMVFKAISATALDYLLIGGPGLPVDDLAVEGQDAPATDADYGNLDVLANAPECARPLFRTNLVGSMFPVSVGLFGLTSAGPGLALFDGRPAPTNAGAGVAFGNTFPGLGDPVRTEVSPAGQFAFANVLSNGAVGVFWLLPGCSPFVFTLGLSGQPTPDGETFAATANWRATAANGVVLFLAPLGGGGSGLYRYGP